MIIITIVPSSCPTTVSFQGIHTYYCLCVVPSAQRGTLVPLLLKSHTQDKTLPPNPTQKISRKRIIVVSGVICIMTLDSETSQFINRLRARQPCGKTLSWYSDKFY
jgi:hypothetical protein